MPLAVDCSNYSSPLTAEGLAAWKAAGVALVLIQSFPPSYTAKYQTQVTQTQQVTDAGLPFGNYVYDYLASPDWRDGCLDGMARLAGQRNLLPYRPWLDEEDVSPDAHALSPSQVVDAIRASRAAVAAWCTAQGVALPPGLYSAPWWWAPMTGGCQDFAGDPGWTAQYDGDPDPTSARMFGGLAVALKQYQGTTSLGGISGVDLSVLAEGELALLSPPAVPTPVPAPDPLQTKVDGLVSAVAYMADDLGDQVRRIAGELERVRVEFVGPRP